MTSRGTRRIGLSLALVGALGAATQAQGAGLSVGGVSVGVSAVAAPAVSVPNVPPPVKLPPPLGGGEPSSASGAPVLTPAPVPRTPRGSVAPVKVPTPPPAQTSAPSSHPGAGSSLPSAGGRGPLGGAIPKAQLRAAGWNSHTHASALATKQQASVSAPGRSGQGPPPSGGGHTPLTSAPAPAHQPLAPLAQHTVMPASPRPDPLGGLTLPPEAGEAMQLALISIAAMLLLGLLFREELKPSLRYRQLLDRITQRPRG